MTIGHLHVGVILLTNRILWDPDYIKHSTDLAISRPDGEVFLCELGSVQVVYHSCEGLEMSIVSFRLSFRLSFRAESEKPKKSTLENWD